MKKEMTSSLELMPDPKVVAAKVRMLILRVHCPQGPSGTLNPTSLAKSLRALRNLQPKEGAKNVWRTRKAKVPGYRRPYDL